MSRFVVFDVETPNRSNSRMSAIGITVVEEGRISDSYFSYVNPEQEFDPFNTRLTGIDAGTVAGSPSFAGVWKDLEPYFSSGILVAHNAAFDMGVLKKCLRDYRISWKSVVPYCCTVQMGRRAVPRLGSYGLDCLCDHFSIELDHHKADSDSRAAAELLTRYLEAGFPVMDYVKSYFL